MFDLILIQILNTSVYCKLTFHHGSFYVVKKSWVSIDALCNFRLKAHALAVTDTASHGRSYLPGVGITSSYRSCITHSCFNVFTINSDRL